MAEYEKTIAQMIGEALRGGARGWHGGAGVQGAEVDSVSTAP